MVDLHIKQAPQYLVNCV